MCLAAPGREQLRTRMFFGRVAMTQSCGLNIFLTCESNTKKGSEKCRARRNTGPVCPDRGVWRDKCDNHTFESSESSWCFHHWLCSHGLCGYLWGGSSLWSTGGSVTSWVSIPCGMPFAMGLGGLIRWKGNWGPLWAWAECRNGKVGEPAIPGVCPAGSSLCVQWHREVFYWPTSLWSDHSWWY